MKRRRRSRSCSPSVDTYKHTRTLFQSYWVKLKPFSEPRGPESSCAATRGPCCNHPQSTDPDSDKSAALCAHKQSVSHWCVDTPWRHTDTHEYTICWVYVVILKTIKLEVDSAQASTPTGNLTPFPSGSTDGTPDSDPDPDLNPI